MKKGIDFGTRTTSAAALVDGRVEHIRFGPQDLFRTAAFFPEQLADLRNFQLTPELEKKIQGYVGAAKSQATRYLAKLASDRRDVLANPNHSEDMKQTLLRLLQPPRPKTDRQYLVEATTFFQRRWLQEENERLSSKIQTGSQAIFGEEAIDRYMDEGAGRLIQSPKSMLGFNLLPSARLAVRDIVASVLEHVRVAASQQLGVDVRGAVIGRPVEFRSADAEGQQRALQLLEEAAAAAGFSQVSFLEEPAAAALGYHHTSNVKHEALIVDIGGGTTDIALAEVGAGPAPAVLRTWGMPRGGTDVDATLSMATAMPMFGYGKLDLLVHHYRDAVLVADMPRQRDFRLRDFSRQPPPYDRRLQTLQQPGMTIRLNRDIEACKVKLSSRPWDACSLCYIEEGLAFRADAATLNDATRSFLMRFSELLMCVNARPDVIFLTGGMSRAPYVQALIDSHFPSARKVQGDPDLGVVAGLAHMAALLGE